VSPEVVHPSQDRLDVRVGDVAILQYVYRPTASAFEGPKPYLHPVRTLAGDVVTGYRPHDHPWHKGLQMTATDVSGQNFWGGVTYVRDKGYDFLPNIGTMRHESFLLEVADAERVTLREKLTWHTQEGEHWVDEVRDLTVRDVDADSWALDFATTLTNITSATLVFGSPTTSGRELAGYTGLFWRGPRDFVGGGFTGGQVLAPDGQGGEDMMGKTAPWLAYVGRHDEVDRSSTLVFLDHPDNSSTHWFVRNEPFAAVNPSFAFFETVDLAAGGTLRLRYRVVVASGSWDRSRVESYLAEHPW
jgi:hypothetical protein